MFSDGFLAGPPGSDASRPVLRHPGLRRDRGVHPQRPTQTAAPPYPSSLTRIVLIQGGGPLTSPVGAPGAENAVPGRISAPSADAAVDRGTAGFHTSIAVGAPVDARPIVGDQEGAQQGIPGVLLVETGAAPGAYGDRPVNVAVVRQRRLERPVVGQFHLVLDDGVHAVRGLFGSAGGHDRTSVIVRYIGPVIITDIRPL